MSSFNPTSDLAIADGIETVALVRRGDDPDAPGTVIQNVLRRAVTTREVAASDGRYTTSDVTWHIPAAELADPPQVGDMLRDSGGQRWTVLEVAATALGSRWRCTARRLAVVEGLDSGPMIPPQPDMLLTYRTRVGRQYATVPADGLFWESDPTTAVAADAVPTVRIPIVKHLVTWHGVSDPPWTAIRACTGAVNRDTFLGAAAETVLFDGAKARRQPQAGWRITYVFREKTIKLLDADQNEITHGWNHGYCPGSAGQQSSGSGDWPAGSHWDRLIDADGNPLYRTVDFGGLFMPETG